MWRGDGYARPARSLTAAASAQRTLAAARVLYQVFSKGFLNRQRNIGGGATPRWGVAPPNNFCLSLLIHAQATPLW
jgi:hypothetical protein